MDLDSDQLYALALEADQHLLGPEQGAWLERLDQEREALHSLLDEFIAAGDSERALLLAGALARFWWMRGHSRGWPGTVGASPVITRWQRRGTGCGPGRGRRSGLRRRGLFWGPAPL